MTREQIMRQEATYWLANASTFKPGDLVRCAGRVHIVLGNEHLICHEATVDAAATEGVPELHWKKGDWKQVTCTNCKNIIKLCATYTAARARKR